MPGDRHAAALQLIFQPPLTTLGDMHLSRLQMRGPALQLSRQRAAVVRVVQCYVLHAPTMLAQCLGKVTHGTEDQRNFLRVVWHIVRFGGHLCEQHRILLRVQSLQTGQIERQLITQYQGEPASGHNTTTSVFGQRRKWLSTMW